MFKHLHDMKGKYSQNVDDTKNAVVKLKVITPQKHKDSDLNT